MGYCYTRASDSENPHRLPDVELVKGYAHECRECGAEFPLFPDYYGILYPEAAECPEGHKGARCTDTRIGWYFAFLDGGLDAWSSEPSGPYPTEAEALAAARSDAGLCEHGADDDEECEPCDAATHAFDVKMGVA